MLCYVRFQRGDHLQVRRWPIPYAHHGIYISDERVIQFGRGISEKLRANIEAVSIDEFEKGARATVAPHGGSTWYGAWRPEADPPDKAVQRAEWLLATHPERMYDLVGYNCEHAASFCATGWPESFQVRGYFAGRALAEGLFLGPWLSRRARAGLPLSRGRRVALYAFFLFGIATVHYSWWVSKRFWERVGLEWRAHERRLGD